ncbi:branched-chain amino acid ABC transporter permease [Cryptosporangium sp. NPDC048952]|uniref:branched-chain amino acid ABC transporter permease n=1 Tax=Cryptosporangium sp. NPDC048952 TaxID=3363961 RepID=UPI003719CF2A
MTTSALQREVEHHPPRRAGAPVGRFHSVRGTGAGVAVLLVVTVLVAASGDPFGASYWLTTLMVVTFAVTWNLIGGLGGQHSFAHPMMFGLGAYAATAMLISVPGAPFWVDVLVGAAAATICSILLTPAFRARGPYFAILTLAASEGLRVAGNAFFPGGSSGQYVPIENSPTAQTALYWGIGITAVAIAVHFYFDQRPIGSALRMLAIDESAAAAIGVPTTRVKVIAFTAGAPMIGAFGAVYVASNTFIDPDTAFDLNFAVLAVLTTLLGGSGLLWGAVVGAIVWQALAQRIHDSGLPPGLSIIVNGLVLLLVILFMPQGLVGTAIRWLPEKLQTRLAARPSAWTRKVDAS